ncbi:MAG: HaeII family restriction endonuclease, partial [Candidatus Omnitrophica bacterium]|nr:HaeII family restriction endonuclease [Candidatus Omnitrophota bacterium]
RIQGIVSINDLDEWYKVCLSKKYRDKLGGSLLKDMEREFKSEFPSSSEIKPFIKERGYGNLSMPEGWKVK